MGESLTPALMISLTLLALSSAASGEPVKLPIAEETWESQTFAAPGADGEPTAVFQIVEDPEMGRALSVGSWQRGRWAARYSHVHPLPFVQGTVRGLYRTENIEQHCAGVWVQYYANGQYLHADTTTFEPAAEWTLFEFVFRRPPPGTERARLGLGLRRHTEGTVLFAALSVTEEVSPVEFPAEPGPVSAWRTAAMSAGWSAHRARPSTPSGPTGRGIGMAVIEPSRTSARCLGCGG